ncbi:MAG: DUF1295 domain-containing protein [Spirochaetales bacterium]|nr:DUF1295 domain-containing protein [Spirochaetales bacterium]
MKFFEFDSLGFLSTLLISFAIQGFFFVFAFSFKTDKVTDLSYSLSFFILAILLYLSNQIKSVSSIVLMVLIVAWSLRLGIYLLGRIIKMKVDHRFDKMRNSFFRFGAFWIIQGITVWAVMLPAIYFFNKKEETSIVFAVIAATLWLIGFVVETVADIQKFRFKNSGGGKNPWIETGLWRYSRHPNYFGEILMWWAIFLFVVPVIESLGWLIILGPCFITFMLIFVSGVSMLEKRYDQKYLSMPEYVQYKRTTSVLLPWFKIRRKV